MLNNELSLLLFKAWILFVYHIQPAFPPDDLAIGAAFLYGSSYLHFVYFYLLQMANSLLLTA